ncbi:MAG: hypothetical protein IM603_13240 [Cytophagales bacterium]|nr:hypothetical protein [Cytophagales bacterium]MCA6420055.1 hypothetical protein [Cytophagales bacterium]
MKAKEGVSKEIVMRVKRGVPRRRLREEKGINAAQFSKAFKGTFVAKLQPKIRGFLNIQLNKQVLKKPASLIMSGGSGAAKLVNGKND